MRGQQKGASESIKKIERRMKVLNEHIHNANDYFEHRALYKEYKQQKPKKQEAFYANHRAGLLLYESAEQYLKKVMNGRTTNPLNAWKAEIVSLASERKTLYSEYLQLKEEVRESEVICRCVEQAFQGKELKPKITKNVSRD